MSHTNIQASDVRSTLAKHILADGYDMVLDLDKSHGSYLVDKITKKEFLDFFTFFASNPLGMNHPALDNDAFIRRIGFFLSSLIAHHLFQDHLLVSWKA